MYQVSWQEAKSACELMNMTLMDKIESNEEAAKLSAALLSILYITTNTIYFVKHM